MNILSDSEKNQLIHLLKKNSRNSLVYDGRRCTYEAKNETYDNVTNCCSGDAIHGASSSRE